MRNHCRVTAPFGNIGLARIVDRVNIEMRDFAKQRVGPAVTGDTELETGHPFHGTVHADVYQRICVESAADPAVERNILVVGSVFLVEKKPHRITLNTKARLYTYEHVTEGNAADEELVGTERSNISRKASPAFFYALAFTDGGDLLVCILVDAESFGFMCLDFVICCLVKHFQQFLRRFRKSADVITFGLKLLKNLVDAFRDIQKGGAGFASHTGRIIIDNKSDFLVFITHMPQLGEFTGES